MGGYRVRSGSSPLFDWRQTLERVTWRSLFRRLWPPSPSQAPRRINQSSNQAISSSSTGRQRVAQDRRGRRLKPRCRARGCQSSRDDANGCAGRRPLGGKHRGMDWMLSMRQVWGLLGSLGTCAVLSFALSACAGIEGCGAVLVGALQRAACTQYLAPIRACAGCMCAEAVFSRTADNTPSRQRLVSRCDWTGCRDTASLAGPCHCQVPGTPGALAGLAMARAADVPCCTICWPLLTATDGFTLSICSFCLFSCSALAAAKTLAHAYIQIHVMTRTRGSPQDAEFHLPSVRRFTADWTRICICIPRMGR